MNPMEIAFMEVELHGAVSLYRFTSDRRTERFELSAAEVDALVAANSRRLGARETLSGSERYSVCR